MKNLSQSTRAYILGVGAVGAAITVGVFFLPAGLRLDLPFLIFLTTALLVQLAGVSVVLPGQERHAYSLLTAVLVGWRLRPEILRVELSRELDLFFALWQRLLRYIAPPAIAVILIAAALRLVTSLSTTGVLQ